MSSSDRCTICSSPTASSIMQATVMLSRQKWSWLALQEMWGNNNMWPSIKEKKKVCQARERWGRGQRLCRREIICSASSLRLANISHVWQYSSYFQHHLWRRGKVSQDLFHNIKTLISQLWKQIKKLNSSLKEQN